MAEEETQEEQVEAPEKKKSNLLLIIIIVVLVLVILIGAVLAVLLMGGDEEETVKEEPKKEKRVSKSRQSSSSNMMEDSRQLSEIGILYPLDTFTVNLKSDAGRRYLKSTISLELEGEELSIELDAKTAVLRDRIIRILSSKTLEEVSSKKGKAKVGAQIKDTLNAMIADGQVLDIYFTEFVVQ